MKRLFLLFLLLLPCSIQAGEIVSTYAEQERIGSNYRTTIHGAPIAYQEAGKWQRIVSNWSDGDASYPNVVTRSRLRTRTAPDGMRRIFPIPLDDTKWMEIGPPYVKKGGGTWTKPAFTGPIRNGNRLTWTNPNATLSVIHYGHGLKLDIELLGGYVPTEGKFAFPVGLNNLTRDGALIRDGQTVVAILRAPYVYDAANIQDVRPIDSQWAQVEGQWYIVFTLPDVSSMSRPTVDPTVTLQPDATAGVDTSLLSLTPTTDFGATVSIAVGESNTAINIARSLILPPLTSIPTSATVTRAALYLYNILDRSNNARMFRVYRMKQAWTEGTGNSAITGDGANWNTYNGVTAWATAGGFGAADCEQADIGSRLCSATETTNAFNVFILNASKIQEMVRGSFSNNGFMIKADTESSDWYSFASSDSATASQRPYLTVDWRRAKKHPRPIPDFMPLP